MNTTTCQELQDLLEQSLRESLSDSNESRVTEHLSECESCRQELESLAAAPAMWQQVERVLRDESNSDDTRATGHWRPLDSAAANPPSQPATFSALADFAVDYLQPCNRPDALGQLGRYASVGSHWPRRYGDCTEGVSTPAESACGHQGVGASSCDQWRCPQAVRPGGASGSGHCASECDANSAGRRFREVAILGNAVCRLRIVTAKDRSRWSDVST